MSSYTTRVCDSCGVQQTDQVSWMTITFPLYEAQNQEMPEEAPDFDFCTYQCLQSWVNESDDDGQADQQQSNGHTSAAVPTMTLAEAIAMGLKPGNPVGQ